MNISAIFSVILHHFIEHYLGLQRRRPAVQVHQIWIVFKDGKKMFVILEIGHCHHNFTPRKLQSTT